MGIQLFSFIFILSTIQPFRSRASKLLRSLNRMSNSPHKPPHAQTNNMKDINK